MKRKARTAAATALGLAAEACGNAHGRGCLGIASDMAFSMPLPRCLLARGLPCSYFERLVLAPALRHADGADLEADYVRGLAASRAEALEAITDAEEHLRLELYPFGHHLPGWERAHARMRLCGCGQRLAPRRRMCDACREAARKGTKTASQRRRRGAESGSGTGRKRARGVV